MKHILTAAMLVALSAPAMAEYVPTDTTLPSVKTIFTDVAEDDNGSSGDGHA